MTIVFATDDCFAQHCAVAMRSVLDYNHDVEFYILTEGLSGENEHRLREVAGSSGLQFCLVDSNAVKDMPMPDSENERISIATWYRMFITRLLPASVSKVIYLDCDLVVRGSLEELWHTDMQGKALAAVYYPANPNVRRNCARLGMAEEPGYFNAGVLLINLDHWREHDLPGRYFRFIGEGKYPLLQRDQDVLNAVTGAETLALPWKYNVMGNELEIIRENVSGDELVYVHSLEKESPVIVHFSFRLKPWELGCRNPYKSEYRALLKRTPYHGTKLYFSWYDFYMFWIIPTLIHPVIMFLKGK